MRSSDITESNSVLHQSIEAGDNEQVRKIIASGINLSKPDSYWGMTPLELAVEKQNPKIVQLLLEVGVSPNSISASSPMHLAADKGEIEIVRLLIAKGAHIDFQHEDDWTPLFEAATSGHLAVVKLLIENGAEPNSEDVYERKPIWYAGCKGFTEVVEYLGQYVSKNDYEEAFREATEGVGVKARRKRERQQARLKSLD